MNNGNAEFQSALRSVRVVDLTDAHGQYCGKLLADLGADVIKIEAPTGDPARDLGPFKHDEPHPDGSLFFAYYNTNKRSLAASLDVSGGEEIFRRLVLWADVIVETPDYCRGGRALSYAALKMLNERLILASISAFGSDGPYREVSATSQSVFALSGLMKSIGPPEGPPVAAPGQLAFDLASADAASGVLCAVLSRRLTGMGQHVSVNALEVLAGQVNPRSRDQFLSKRYRYVYNPGLAPGGTFACRDGGVELTIILPSHWEGLKELLGNPPELDGAEWNTRAYRESRAEYLGELVANAFASWSQADLVKEAQRLRVPCGPINTVDAFATDTHMAERGFFVSVDSTLGHHQMPGAPYKFSQAGWAFRRPAPRTGEHSREVLEELGYAGHEIEALRSAGVVATPEALAAAERQVLP